jgi:hypothetical protein
MHLVLVHSKQTSGGMAVKTDQLQKLMFLLKLSQLPRFANLPTVDRSSSVVTAHKRLVQFNHHHARCEAYGASKGSRPIHHIPILPTNLRTQYCSTKGSVFSHFMNLRLYKSTDWILVLSTALIATILGLGPVIHSRRIGLWTSCGKIYLVQGSCPLKIRKSCKTLT